MLDGIVLKRLLRRYSCFGEPGFNRPNARWASFTEIAHSIP